MKIYDTSYLFDEITTGKEPSGAVLDLTLYEITNVVRKAVERGEISKGDGETLLHYVSTLDLDIVRAQMEDLPKILQIALKYNLSAYDAAYVYFAIQENLDLKTKDSKLRRAYEEIRKKGYV